MAGVAGAEPRLLIRPRNELTVRDLRTQGIRRLRRRGIPEPGLDTDLLLAHALRTDRSGVYRKLLDVVEFKDRLSFQHLVRLRRSRVPTAYLRGEREFFGFRFVVGPPVLVPRPETELLVASCRDFLQRTGNGGRVLDVGTGSGNIAISVALLCPESRIIAIDLSPGALAIARENIRLHDVMSRVSLLRADASHLQAVFSTASFDALVCNPPYVDPPAGGFREELAHEPAIALAGVLGAFPAYYEVLAKASLQLLRPGGRLFLEVGEGQDGIVSDCLSAVGGFSILRVRKDSQGIPRMVEAARQ